MFTGFTIGTWTLLFKDHSLFPFWGHEIIICLNVECDGMSYVSGRLNSCTVTYLLEVKSISPQTRDNDRQKTFYKYFNVNFHQNLQQYMLINNSSHLYIPNNTLHNNWLKQICRISQKVCRGDWTGNRTVGWFWDNATVTGACGNGLLGFKYSEGERQKI